MRVEVHDDSPLWFGPGLPVRAASAIAAFGDGWLVAQDDATHAAWLRPAGVTAVRVFPPVEGHDTFSSTEGTKHLKPDFEAAVALDGGGVLLLGSGSTAARMRGALVTAPGSVTILELAPVYHRVAAALGLPVDQLNLEGAARIGDRLRWFQRGNSAAGVPSAAVDVSLTALLGTGQADAGGAGETKVGNAGETQVGSAIGTEVGGANEAQVGNAGETQVGGTSKAQVDGAGDARVGGAGEVEVGGAQAYDLGAVGGVALAVTDAVALPDGRVLVSAAAEDTPNAVDDGPVVGAAIALLDDTTVLAIAALPSGPPKAAKTDQSSNSKPHEGEQHEGEQHEGGQHEGGRGRTGRRQAERHEAEQHKAVSPARPYKIEGLALQDFGPGGVTLIAVVDADDPLAASRRLELRVFW